MLESKMLIIARYMATTTKMDKKAQSAFKPALIKSTQIKWVGKRKKTHNHKTKLKCLKYLWLSLAKLQNLTVLGTQEKISQIKTGCQCNPVPLENVSVFLTKAKHQ